MARRCSAVLYCMPGRAGPCSTQTHARSRRPLTSCPGAIYHICAPGCYRTTAVWEDEAPPSVIHPTHPDSTLQGGVCGRHIDGLQVPHVPLPELCTACDRRQQHRQQAAGPGAGGDAGRVSPLMRRGGRLGGICRPAAQRLLPAACPPQQPRRPPPRAPLPAAAACSCGLTSFHIPHTSVRQTGGKVTRQWAPISEACQASVCPGAQLHMVLREETHIAQLYVNEYMHAMCMQPAGNPSATCVHAHGMCMCICRCGSLLCAQPRAPRLHLGQRH